MPKLQNGLFRNTGSKVWHYHFRHRGLVYKGTTKLESLTLARDWLMAFRINLANQDVGLATKALPTLRAIWQAWDEIRGPVVSPSHRRFMRVTIHLHAGPYLDLPADQLKTGALDELCTVYLTTKGQGYSRNGESTVHGHSEGGWNRVASQIRALYNWAVETERLPKVPFRIRKLEASQKAKDILWPEQVQAFLAAVDEGRAGTEPMGLAVRMMIGLGLRESEALNADWERVDWRRGVFVVAESSEGVRIKDRSLREITIPSWLRSVLQSWHQAAGSPDAGLILPGKSGAHVQGSTDRAVQRGARALRITLTPHRLRATFATVQYEAGTPLDQIAAMMGHEDPTLTLTRYIVRRQRLQEQAQELAARLMGF